MPVIAYFLVMMEKSIMKRHIRQSHKSQLSTHDLSFLAFMGHCQMGGFMSCLGEEVILQVRLSPMLLMLTSMRTGQTSRESSWPIQKSCRILHQFHRSPTMSFGSFPSWEHRFFRKNQFFL